MDARITIEYDDLPPEWMEAADVLGLDAVVGLARNFGGELLYIPRVERFEREGRNRMIRAERKAGAGTKELAIHWGLSDRQILRIVGEPE